MNTCNTCACDGVCDHNVNGFETCGNWIPKWISVEERLPEEWRVKGGDLVNHFVYMPEYGVDVGNYAKPVKTWLCMGIPCKVTHWMPLPETPKENTDVEAD